MAFFQQVLKARKLRNARLDYHDEKLKSIAISKGAKIDYNIFERIRYIKLLIKKKVKDFFQKLITCQGTWFYKKVLLLQTDGTLENYVLKSVFGFLGGIFLTYLFFIFFIFQLHFSLTSATIWCSLLGIVLTLGLAFSERVRCIVFLIMPQFLTKRGRQALMAYAFILALTGPAKNTLNNIGVLSESLSCGEEHLKEAIKAILDLIKEPFNALKDAITKVLKSIKVIVNKIKRALIAIKRLVLSILKVIQSVYQWLGSVVNMCNKKLGTPFERCNRAFEDAVVDCKAKLGSLLGGVCNITYVVGAVCNIVKPFDFICMLVTFVSDTIVKIVQKKIKKFAKHMKAMFYVKVKFSHSFHFESNRSRSSSEISKGISTEIKQRSERFFVFFDMLSFLTSSFIFLLLLRVILYRHKWLTKPRFDNRYLTNYLREIDLQRARLDKETVLPLNPREKNKYVPLSSIRLIKAEKVNLVKSAVFMSLTSFKLLFQMAIDYCLFWILNIIRYHGRFETKIPDVNSVEIHVSGNGFLAEIYRSIVKAFSLSSSEEEEINMMPCLPDPIPPNYDRYLQILTLMFICWILIIFEPYGLRIRQCVMISYHPDRAKERAVWLYNHILRSRGNFLKFARRQLRRKFGMKGAQNTEKVTLKERLTAICPILQKCFSSDKIACLLCGAIERDSQIPHVKCPTPDCVGIFCVQCFSDLQNMCTVCKSPIDYGDLSDISEEKDSSEEDAIQARKSVISDVKEETKDTEKIYKIEEGVEVIEEDINSISSSSTEYSYTYQDDESQVDKYRPQKIPFKDVEAQKLRDDVSTQIFSSPTEDMDSECESPACFGLRSRKKQKSKFEDDDSPSARRASLSSDEIEEEELINEKLDDDSKLLLPKYKKDKKEKISKRIKKIFTGFLKFFSFGKTKKSEKLSKKYKRMEKEDDEEVKSYSSSSSTSSSTYSIDYRKKLLVKSYDSFGEIKFDQEDKRILKYPHEKQFFTKKLPRGLAPITKRTRYFEVDERLNQPYKCSYDKEDLNNSSDSKTSDTSQVTEIQLGSVEEVDELKYSASSVITSVKEDIPESSRSINIQHDFNESTDDTKNYVDVTGVSSNSSVQKVYDEKPDHEKIIKMRDKNQNINNTEKYFYKPKARQTEKEVPSETNNEKLSTERRLLRRRYNENYYSSSENEHESLRSEREIQISSCKHCCEREKSRSTRKHLTRDHCSKINCKLCEPEDKSFCHCKCQKGHQGFFEYQEKGSSENEEVDEKSYQRDENVLGHKMKLINELERDERIKSIRKREDERQKRYDIIRYMREQGSSQRDSKICQRSPHTIRTRKKRNTLPYQETEAFKSLLKEYQEKALGEEKIISGDFSGNASFEEQLDSESANESSYISQKVSLSEDSTDNNETTN